MVCPIRIFPTPGCLRCVMSKNSRNRGGVALFFLCQGGRGEARARSPMFSESFIVPPVWGGICAWVGRVGSGLIVLFGVAWLLC